MARWATQDARLREAWQDRRLSLEDIAHELGRTVLAVKVHASRLHLGQRPRHLSAAPSAARHRKAEDQQQCGTEAGVVRCLAQVSPCCHGLFWSADKTRNRVCPECKKTPEWKGPDEWTMSLNI